jgi:hypothetical protein
MRTLMSLFTILVIVVVQGCGFLKLNQVFTEKMNITIGKRIAKKVGRAIVGKKIWPMFENLRTVFKNKPCNKPSARNS